MTLASQAFAFPIFFILLLLLLATCFDIQAEWKAFGGINHPL